MTGSEERKAGESRDSETIHIEMPCHSLAKMCEMMLRFCSLDSPGSSRNDTRQSTCCSEDRSGTGQEYRFVIRKEG